MSVKILPELLLHRQHVFSRIVNVNLFRTNVRYFANASETTRKDELQNGGSDKNSSSSWVPSFAGSSNQNRLGHLMQLYEDLVGLTEVKLAQEKVVNAEQKFLQVQDDRRAMQQELMSVQVDVRAVAAELEKTSRTDTRYIDLVKKEHEALLIEKEMTNRIKTLDKAERDFFALLSTALRESHEKERARAEKTKYWSIIGSVVGAIIGIIGSTFNNFKRMKELRAIVTESGENTAEYKALANKMVETVHSQHSQIEEFVDRMKNVQHVSGIEAIRLTDPLFVNHRDFSQHTEKLLAALQDHSQTLMKHLNEIHKQLNIQKSSENNDHVIYVGPDVEQMFLRSEQKLQAEFQMSRWITTAAFGGLVVISLCAFLFKGSF